VAFNFGQAACETCTAGFSGNLSRTLCLPTPAGYYNDGVNGTKLCPLGQYSYNGSSYCQNCPHGQSTFNQPSTTVSSCAKCRPGTYSTGPGTACTKCLRGTFSTVEGAKTSDVCQQCPPNSVAPYPGSASCTPCGSRQTTYDGYTCSCVPGYVWNGTSCV
jgi:hypothetical protein